MASVKFFPPPYINGRNVENVTLRFLTNCVCVKRLLIKFGPQEGECHFMLF